MRLREEPLLQFAREREPVLEAHLHSRRDRALDEPDCARGLARRDKLPRVLERLPANRPPERTRKPLRSSGAGQVHAWRGEKDLAFQWLDRAYAQHDAGLVRLRYDRPFASLRTNPRFVALVRKVGLPD